MWQTAGQDTAVTLLKRGFEKNKLAHAYLVVGPQQVGKGTLANDLAMALNCSGHEPPCGECSSCRRIQNGIHPDVQIIGVETDDDERNRRDISIEQIRDLQKWANLEPFEGGRRVFIIDEAERLSLDAANCLLKTLEEPPAKVMLFLLAENEEALLPTIRSRCQRLELKPVPADQTEALLKERWQVDDNLARTLSRACNGRIGWALTSLANEELLEERSAQAQRLLHLASADRNECFAFAAEEASHFARERERVRNTLTLWTSLMRDLMLLKGGCQERISNIQEEDVLHEQASHFSMHQIATFIKALRACMRHLERNVNPQLALEVLVLDLPNLNARKEERETAPA